MRPIPAQISTAQQGKIPAVVLNESLMSWPECLIEQRHCCPSLLMCFFSKLVMVRVTCRAGDHQQLRRSALTVHFRGRENETGKILTSQPAQKHTANREGFRLIDYPPGKLKA